MKRAAEPAEIARLAVFLASSDADYVTGATYVMDGGLMRNLGQVREHASTTWLKLDARRRTRSAGR